MIFPKNSAAVMLGLLLLFSFCIAGDPECSNQGKFCPDSNTCFCNDCFSGPQCEVNNLATCQIIDVGGTPQMYQEYWEHQDLKETYSVTIDADYRTPYMTEKLLPLLNQTIRQLHSTFQNAETEGYTIVIGSGCTHLIAAATYALQQLSKKDKITVFAKAPYYGGYKDWADMYPSSTVFNQSLTGLDPSSLIEFVTLPNNPTGEHRYKPFYNTKYVVHDMVYYWPSLTNIYFAANYDVMLFSMSKMSGHAGTRLGWALVKNPAVAALMNKFIGTTSNHVSVEAQYRALRIMEAVIETKGDMFDWVKEKLQSRWTIIQQVLSNSDRFSIESIPGQYYLFLRCKQFPTKDSNCFDVLQSVGIKGWEGAGFGMPKGQYVRMELVVQDAIFDEIVRRLKTIV